MDLLAISGSLRAGSSNTAILRACAAYAPPGVRVTLFEGIGEMPPFSPERDVEPAPEAVRWLREAIAGVDGVIFCTPEYAFGVPGTLKNALDWMVSSGSLDGKPVALIAAGPGGALRAQASLALTLTALGTLQSQATTLSVSGTRAKISDDGQVMDAATEAALRGVVAALVNAIEARQGGV